LTEAITFILFSNRVTSRGTQCGPVKGHTASVPR
jgi:hypothetical protein